LHNPEGEKEESRVRRTRSKTHPAASQPRIDHVLESMEKDVYGQKGKLADPTACRDCGAVYHKGRWTWGAPPADAARATCPACRRIADHYPAGIVTLSGDFAREHAEEIRGLVRHVEEREKKEHALKRVMAIERDGDALVVKTTNARLARGIGEAVQHAYKGELDYRFSETENVLRVDWKR
jgi:NMD protein affecting ribosome stability and mRNA decay